MSFVSIEFVIFIAITILAYYLIGKFLPDFQWVILLISSYIFYGFITPKYVIFLLFSTFITWLFPLLMCRDPQRKKLYLILCIVCNIGLLVILKYANFVLGIFNVSKIDWFILPLGISFYTFQSTGYCIDVYREIVPAENNFFKHALYVSFFPQICQGPIGKYEDLSPQLFAAHSFNYQNFTDGFTRILVGYFKKIFVATTISSFVDVVYASPNTYSGAILAFATVLYGFQLYADFSGYMDISLGTACCLGITMKENFFAPYFSRSIAEFWRRWHISLGDWFRDYLYYPVLRSNALTKLSKKLRKSGHKKAAKNLTTAIGLLVTWFLIGLWHGADTKYILYGLFHGAFVILAALLGETYAKLRNNCRINESSLLWKAFQICRTFIIVSFAYVLFRADSLQSAAAIYNRIFTQFYYSGWTGDILGRFDIEYAVLVIIGILMILLIDIIDLHGGFVKKVSRLKTAPKWIVLYCFMLGLIYIFLFTDTPVSDASNFIYFNF